MESPNKFLYVVPIVTGTLSIAASSSIIWKILRSETKLRSPHSRIIFGLSFCDIVSSTANALSVLPSPPSPYGFDVWGAHGNDTTCRIQGFLFTWSSGSSPFYNFSLCIYYLCLIRYSMRDERFGRVLEPALHIIPFVYSSALSIYLLANDFYRFNGTVCWVAQKSADDLDFIRIFGTITIGGPIFFSFLAVNVIMGILTYTVWSQENRMNRYRFELGIGADGNVRSSMIDRAPRRRLASENRIRSVLTQAYLFFLAFIFTFTFPIIYRLMRGFGVEPPATILYLSRTLYPMQGVFNLFAHLHPQTITALRNDRDLSYFKAVLVAFKNYEDALDERTQANSNGRGGNLGQRRSASVANSNRNDEGVLLSSRNSRRSSRHLSSIEHVHVTSPSTRRNSVFFFPFMNRRRSSLFATTGSPRSTTRSLHSPLNIPARRLESPEEDRRTHSTEEATPHESFEKAEQAESPTATTASRLHSPTHDSSALFLDMTSFNQRHLSAPQTELENCGDGIISHLTTLTIATAPEAAPHDS